MLVFRGLAIWIVIIAVEIVHGIVRGIYLVPRVGDLRSRQIGIFTGSLLVFAIALAFSNWLAATSVSRQLGIGLLWVILTIIFEAAFGGFVIGADPARILADYNLPNGGLMSIGLLLMLLTPAISSWFRSNVTR